MVAHTSIAKRRGPNGSACLKLEPQAFGGYPTGSAKRPWQHYDETVLREHVQMFLGQVAVSSAWQSWLLRGALTSHAPLAMSGHVQAHVFAAIREFRPETVVVVAHNHLSVEKLGRRVAGVRLPDFTHIETPFSELEVDKDLALAVCGEPTEAKAYLSITGDQSVYIDQHPLAVPFLWLSAISETLDYSMKVAPLVIGLPSGGFEQGLDGWLLGRGMAAQRFGGRNLMLVSANLCHRQDQQITEAMDIMTLERVAQSDREGFYGYIEGQDAARNQWDTNITAACSLPAISAFIGLREALLNPKVVELSRGSTHHLIEEKEGNAGKIGMASLALVENFPDDKKG